MPELKDYIEVSKAAKSDIKTIYNIIEDDVNNEVTLSDLDNISKASKEGLMLYIPAYISYFFETYVLSVFKKDIQTIIDNNTNLTDPWWVTEMKKFQDGDTLTYYPDTFKYGYDTIDEVKQIIKYVSSITKAGVCTVKLAKEDKVKLTTDELTRAIAFGRKVQPAGSNIEFISLETDKLKFVATVYFNAERNEVDFKASLEAAVESYISNLTYDGKFSIQSATDKIQALGSDVDIVISLVEARPDAEPTFTTITRDYLTYSGVLEIDGDFPLSDTITYVKE